MKETENDYLYLLNLDYKNVDKEWGFAGILVENKKIKFFWTQNNFVFLRLSFYIKILRC